MAFCVLYGKEELESKNQEIPSDWTEYNCDGCGRSCLAPESYKDFLNSSKDPYMGLCMECAMAYLSGEEDEMGRSEASQV